MQGVGAAAGAIFNLNGATDEAKLIGKDGKPITTAGGSPNFGWGIDTAQPRLNPLTLKQGNWAAAPDQVVIDIATAENEHFKVGDRIGVAAQGPTRQFRVSGIAQFGSVKSLAAPPSPSSRWPPRRRCSTSGASWMPSSLAASPGTSPAQLAARVRPLLPASAQIQTSAQRARPTPRTPRKH